MKIEIPLLCRSKKNSQKIWYNPKTKRTMIVQSDIYKQFERDCAYFLPKLKEPISKPVNLKCTFIVPDRRKRDLTNLENAIADILVKYKVLKDDDYTILTSWDGSRIIYEKGIEKTIVEIEEI
jgi:Holliday junction resolvase RusA-like endonuclease